MGELDIDKAVASNLKDAETDYSVDRKSVEGAIDQKETRWQSTRWTQDLGYYKVIPELRSAILAFARWTVGRGYEAAPEVEFTLNQIRGWGKDSFNSILKGLVSVAKLTGDAYAEIIPDSKGRLINLKPLNNETIVHVCDKQGMLIRYEQSSRVEGKKNKTFLPHQILHICFERATDEIHGTGVAEALEWMILARNEGMTDYKKLMHRHVAPRFIHKLDTDDQTKINSYKAKNDAAHADGEDIYIPQGSVEMEQLSVSPNSTLDPKTWIEQLGNNFYKVIGVPQIIVGGSTEFTEASAKIAYLAWQQTVEETQLLIEEQILNQLNLEIKLTFPASLENETLNPRPNAEEQQSQMINPPEIQANEKAIEPNDQKVEGEGRK